MDWIADILPLLVFFVLVAVNIITQRAKSRERRGRPTAPARRSDAGSDFEVARMLGEALKRKFAEENGVFGKSDGGLGGEAGMYGGGMSDSDTEESDEFDEYDDSEESAKPAVAPRASLTEIPDLDERLRRLEESDEYRMPTPAAFAHQDPTDWSAARDSEVDGDYGVLDGCDCGERAARAHFDVAFKSSDDLKKAFVYKEIISEPLALRARGEFKVW